MTESIARLEIDGESLSLQGFSPLDEFYCIQWLDSLFVRMQGILCKKVSFWGHGTEVLKKNVSEIRDFGEISDSIWKSCKNAYEEWGKNAKG